MRYLKLSMQRNRRRIRIEQILLLLLRTAIVLLLFFVLARPMMHAEGLSRWLGGSGAHQSDRVAGRFAQHGLLGRRQDGARPRARGANDLLSTFAPKDRFTLVLASQPKQPLLREVELDNLDDIMMVVRDVTASESFGAWEPILQAIDELIAGGSYPLHEVTLITDLRTSGWEAQLAELGNRWAGQRVRLRVFDVGVASGENVALLALVQADRLALAGTPTRFEAELRNDSGGELAGLEANFIVDGKPSLVRVPTLASGEVVRLPLIATFQEAGTHHVAFELPHDNLAGDNSRWAVVEVQQTIDMLLVDGEPSSEALGGETDFLALALSLSGDAAEAFRVEVMTDSQWVSSPLTRPDLLVLANVAHLSADQVEIIEQMVSAGMGLMIFVGDQIDPDNYNQLLFKAGSGMMGAALEGISDTEFAGMLIEAGDGSPLDAVSQLTPAALQRIKIRKSYEVRLPGGEAEGVRVLARWNNAASSPAVVQKVYGKGQVLLWTTAADRSWSDWPTEASYVLAVREAARAIAKTTASLHELSAGQTLGVALPASHDITQPTIEVPAVDEPKALVVDSTASAAGGSPGEQPPAAKGKPVRRLQFSDTRRAGLYKFGWHDSVSGAMSETFAVNPDPRESDLQRIASDEFKKSWGALEPEVVSIGTPGDSAAAVRGQEIWRTLCGGLLGMLVLEACFARWAGRQR